MGYPERPAGRGGYTLKILRTDGCCPQCGEGCTHVHGWTLQGLRDTYACGACGVTEYRVVECAS